MKRELLIKEAWAGNEVAQVELGCKILAGKIPGKRKDAFVWFEKAADKGENIAAYNWSLELLRKREFKNSFKYAVLAASGQLAVRDAILAVGWHCLTGTGTRKNETKAIDFFVKAACMGCPASSYNLGEIFKEKSDSKSSFKWYWIGAGLGSIKCSYRLGRQLFMGDGCDRNYILAKRHLTRACRGGMKKAEKLLKTVTNEVEKGIEEKTRKEVNNEDILNHFLLHGDWYDHCALSSSYKVAVGPTIQGELFDLDCRNKRISLGSAADSYGYLKLECIIGGIRKEARFIPIDRENALLIWGKREDQVWQMKPYIKT
jgi:hypothetical protein